MNHPVPCRLTKKDHAVLEAVLERSAEAGGALAGLLGRKLAGAGIWLDQDIPANVVTLDSRVLFCADGGPVETCTVALAPDSAAGEDISADALRGLALLGLAEGESFQLDEEGVPARLTVQSVTYQPEAAQRTEQRARNAPRGPGLRLVHSAAEPPRQAQAQPVNETSPYRFDDDDDPGPSAA